MATQLRNTLLTLGYVMMAAPVFANADTGRGFNLSNSSTTSPTSTPTTEPIFLFSKTSSSSNGQEISKATYTDPSGKVLVSEEAVFTRVNDKLRIKSYEILQKQLETVGKVEVKDGRAEFSFTKAGKTKTASEKAEDNFVVGPGIVAFLTENWAAIAGGKTLKVRLAVPDRLETVGFEYSKEKEEKLNNEDVVTVKMKPSSFFIAALVNPLHFSFTPDGKRLVGIRGRTQVKRADKNSFKDLDALTLYDK